MNKSIHREERLFRFADAGRMFATLADEIAMRLQDGVAARGMASMVASGGTTPGPLYDDLSGRALDWEKIHVTLSDERWVSPASDSSNEKLVRTCLLRGRAAAAGFVPLKTEQASPAEAEIEVNRALATMPRPFDVTLLGMGEDGHTASLFPGADGLSAALDLSSPALARAITPAEAKGSSERLSLTLHAILGSRLIAILIRGEAKMAAYQKAVSGSDVSAMPVRAVLGQSQTPVLVYWAS